MKHRMKIASIIYLLTLPIFAQVNNDDLQALRALYNSTDGENWTNNENWDMISQNIFPPLFNLGDLHGVNVDFVTKRVTAIDLENNGLVGFIPSDIEFLESLTELNLVLNDLSTTTFTTIGKIGQLPNIQFINLTACNLFTTIPLNFWGNPTLEVIIAFNNHLLLEADSIPPSIGEMASLKVIILTNNNLKCKIPKELANCNQLTTLNLSMNECYGIIPRELGTMNSLDNLDLSFNNFSGDLNSSFDRGDGYSAFNISNNQFSGSIPDAITSSSTMQFLDVSNNLLNGPLPKSLFVNKFSLRAINVSNNYMTCIIPSEIGNITTLQNIDLSHNRFTGGLPIQISNLTNLQTFQINDNLLSGCLDTAVLRDLLCGIDSNLDNNDFNTSIDKWCNNDDGGCGPEGPPIYPIFNSTGNENTWYSADTWEPLQVPSVCDEAIIKSGTIVKSNLQEQSCTLLQIEIGGTLEVISPGGLEVKHP